MTTSRIAIRLVELCRQGLFAVAQTELFADDAVSVEPRGAPVEVTQGLTARRDNGHRFMSSIAELHCIEVSEPLVAGNHFSVAMSLESNAIDRHRVTIEEVCVYYSVGRGKIVREQLFRTAAA